MSPFLAAATLLSLLAVGLFVRRLRNPHALARAGWHQALARRLQQAPGLVHQRDGGGETPLHHAARYGELEAMRVLLEAGADVHAPDGRRATPLHHAAMSQTPEAVRLLLARGAEVNARDEEGFRPYHVAQATEDAQIQAVLREAGADTETPPVLVQMGRDHWMSPVAENDPEMSAAHGRAQAALPLLRELFAASPEDAMVKFPLRTDTGETEHVWGRLVALDADGFTARVVTPPTSQQGPLEPVQRRPFSDLEDWQVEQRDGTVRGGFAVQVMFKVVRRELGALPAGMAEHEKRYVDVVPAAQRASGD